MAEERVETVARAQDPELASRAVRRAELIQQLADLRALRERLHPLRTKIERERAALRRTLGRL